MSESHDEMEAKLEQELAEVLKEAEEIVDVSAELDEVEEDAAVEAAEEIIDEAIELGAPSLSAAIEAILLLADEPISSVNLAQIVRRPVPEVDETIAALVAEYDEAERGFELREVAGGWRYYTRLSCSLVIERMVLDGQQSRLTQAALETLAVIAYRQPVSRGRVAAVRGVSVDGVIRTLLSRGLIEEAGMEQVSGAILYRTTPYFLERMGINSLADLPPLAEHLPDFSELDDLLGLGSTAE